MLDAPVRRALAPTLDRAAALRLWPAALALWLGNRFVCLLLPGAGTCQSLS